MSEQAIPNNSTSTPTEVGQVSGIAREGATVHPDLLDWVNEAKRLFEEAEERLESGSYLPALSSLAAVLPLHKMLMGRCSKMLKPAEIDDVSDAPHGVYL